MANFVQTLAMAFTRAKDTIDTSPPLEQTSTVACIESFASTNLEGSLVPYDDAIKKKRLFVPTMNEAALPVRPFCISIIFT